MKIYCANTDIDSIDATDPCWDDINFYVGKDLWVYARITEDLDQPRDGYTKQWKFRYIRILRKNGVTGFPGTGDRSDVFIINKIDAAIFNRPDYALNYTQEGIDKLLNQTYEVPAYHIDIPRGASVMTTDDIIRRLTPRLSKSRKTTRGNKSPLDAYIGTDVYVKVCAVGYYPCYVNVLEKSQDGKNYIAQVIDADIVEGRRKHFSRNFLPQRFPISCMISSPLECIDADDLMRQLGVTE